MSSHGLDQLDKSLLLCSESLTHEESETTFVDQINELVVNVHIKKKNKLYPIGGSPHLGFYHKNIKQSSKKNIDSSKKNVDSSNKNVDCCVVNDFDTDLVNLLSPCDRLILTQESQDYDDSSRLILNEHRASFKSEKVNRSSEHNTNSENSYCVDEEGHTITHTTVSTDTPYIAHPSAIPSHPLPVFVMNLSFCGAGFLGIYHLGVAKALVSHGSRFMLNVQQFSGASAGILVASVLAVKGPDKESIDKCSEFTFKLAKQARKKSMGVLTPRYSLLQPLEEFLNEICPENGHEVASGKLHVSLTRLRGGKNITVSQFHSKHHFIQCLLASSYIPFITGTKIFTIDGQKYIDGGLTDNLPRVGNGRTVTVSPFCGKEDICPVDARWKGRYTHIGNMSVQVSPDNGKRGYHAFFPPKTEKLETYFDRGFQDAVRFLKKEGYYQQ